MNAASKTFYVADGNEMRRQAIINTLRTFEQVVVADLLDAPIMPPEPSVIFAHITDIERRADTIAQIVKKATEQGNVTIVYSNRSVNNSVQIEHQLKKIGISKSKSVCIVSKPIDQTGFTLSDLNKLMKLIIVEDKSLHLSNSDCLSCRPPIYLAALSTLCHGCLAKVKESSETTQALKVRWWRTIFFDSDTVALATMVQEWEAQMDQTFPTEINQLMTSFDQEDDIIRIELVSASYSALLPMFINSSHNFYVDILRDHLIKNAGDLSIVAVYDDLQFAKAVKQVLELSDIEAKLADVSKDRLLPKQGAFTIVLWSYNWGCDQEKLWLYEIDQEIRRHENVAHIGSVQILALGVLDNPFLNYMKASGATLISFNSLISGTQEPLRPMVLRPLLENSLLYESLCQRIKSCMNHQEWDKRSAITKLSSLLPNIAERLN